MAESAGPDDAGPSAECPQRVTFTITEDDIYRFLAYHTLHDGASLCALIAGALFLYVLTVTLVSTLFKGTGPGFAALWGLLAVLFFLFSYPWYLRDRARRGKHTLPGSIGERTVGISHDGLFTSATLGEGTLKWVAFYRVVGTPDYLYLYVGRGAATIVPRRAFPSTIEWEAFLQTARKWQAEAAAGRSQGEGKTSRTVWVLAAILAVVVLVSVGVLLSWWLVSLLKTQG